MTVLWHTRYSQLSRDEYTVSAKCSVYTLKIFSIPIDVNCCLLREGQQLYFPEVTEHCRFHTAQEISSFQTIAFVYIHLGLRRSIEETFSHLSAVNGDCPTIETVRYGEHTRRKVSLNKK
jgi:hypothetical protein